MRSFVKGLWLMTSAFFFAIPIWTIRRSFIKLFLRKIGSGCFFMRHVILNREEMLEGRGGRLMIGDNVDIAQETNIWTLEHDVNDNQHSEIPGDVIIEDHVWIASRVTLLPGVKIGRGAVVASGAVVTRNIPPLAIVGGIPAKIIGYRKNDLTYKLNYFPWFQ